MEQFYRDSKIIVINHGGSGIKEPKTFASVNAAKRESRDMQKRGAKYVPFINWKRSATL